MKFKIGDRVKVVKVINVCDDIKQYIGTIANVTEINENLFYPYKLDVNEVFKEEELELVEDNIQSEEKVFTDDEAFNQAMGLLEMNKEEIVRAYALKELTNEVREELGYEKEQDWIIKEILEYLIMKDKLDLM